MANHVHDILAVAIHIVSGLWSEVAVLVGDGYPPAKSGCFRLLGRSP
jgi:hypothetical protein